MGWDDAVKDGMLDLIDETSGAFPVTHISLHTADPGTDGSNEVAGGAYARQAITWGAASGGVKSNTGELVFNVPAGVTVTHLAGWTASSGGTFRGGGELTAPQAFATPGTYTLAVGDVDATI